MLTGATLGPARTDGSPIDPGSKTRDFSAPADHTSVTSDVLMRLVNEDQKS